MKALGVLLISGGHERAHYALVVAAGAAALGRDVTLFVTNDGCALFMAAQPLLADPREALVEARGVAGIRVLADAVAELGVRRIVCEAGLLVTATEPSAVAAGVEVAGIATLLEAVGAGQIVTI